MEHFSCHTFICLHMDIVKKNSLEDPAGAALLLENFINKLQHVTSFSHFPPIHWQIKEGACVFSCTTCELYETMKRGC